MTLLAVRTSGLASFYGQGVNTLVSLVDAVWYLLQDGSFMLPSPVTTTCRNIVFLKNWEKSEENKKISQFEVQLTKLLMVALNCNTNTKTYCGKKCGPHTMECALEWIWIRLGVIFWAMQSLVLLLFHIILVSYRSYVLEDEWSVNCCIAWRWNEQWSYATINIRGRECIAICS